MDHVITALSWEHKVRVLAVWMTAALYGRDEAFVARGNPLRSERPEDAAP
jgi:NADH:ubiquinone reductase (H+-translocating)